MGIEKASRDSLRIWAKDMKSLGRILKHAIIQTDRNRNSRTTGRTKDVRIWSVRTKPLAIADLISIGLNSGQKNYARGRGYPGHNRTPMKQDGARPPIEPVRMNYPAIEGWWKRTTGKNFGPKFARPAGADVEAEPFDRNNPAARFLILVVQYLDRKYDPANARGLVYTVKRQRAGGRKNGRKNMPPKVRE